MILLLESAHADAEELLDRYGEVVRAPDIASLDDAQKAAIRAIVTRGLGDVSAAAISQLPSLEVVARCGVGLDNVDTAAAATAGVTVVHAPGSTTSSVAEHAVMLMLALGRQLTRLDREVSSGNWAVRSGHQGLELRGKTLGIIGLGDIGSRLAELGRAFAMDVICATRRPQSAPVERVELDQLLTRADVIQVCIPLNDSTRGYISTQQFEMMKPGALLVNTARAAIVDHGALLAALDSANGGTLGGYATDLWDPEPPLDDDPLLTHDRVIITPHVAALTDMTYREMCMRPVESVLSILRGDGPTPNTVFELPSSQ